MKGFSLLEVSIALVLLSLVIALVGQQQLQCKNTLRQIYFKHIALEQALSIIDRLQVNTQVAYRLHEIKKWNEDNATLLPHGVGNVTLAQNYHINICWDVGKNRACFLFPHRSQ